MEEIIKLKAKVFDVISEIERLSGIRNQLLQMIRQEQQNPIKENIKPKEKPNVKKPKDLNT